MVKSTRAATYNEFGGVDKIQKSKVELPELKEGEVLIKVKAAGVNPVDAVILNGRYKDLMPHNFPVIPGWDVAGIIEERGHAARRFSRGDGVYGYARRPEVKWGTFSEYMIIPECYLALRPEVLSWEEAACIPLAGLTAYQSLYEAGGLKEGERVLILGASGGVGSFAIQLAKLKGAQVAGVASEENSTYMKKLGADHTINYKDRHLGEATKEIWHEGADLIFDCTGGESLQQSLDALKANGRVISIMSRGEDIDEDIHFKFVFVEPNSRQLEDLQELADEGKLKVKLTKTYGLDETAEALKQIQTLHTTGKIVIVP